MSFRKRKKKFKKGKHPRRKWTQWFFGIKKGKKVFKTLLSLRSGAEELQLKGHMLVFSQIRQGQFH